MPDLLYIVVLFSKHMVYISTLLSSIFSLFQVCIAFINYHHYTFFHLHPFIFGLLRLDLAESAYEGPGAVTFTYNGVDSESMKCIL